MGINVNNIKWIFVAVVVVVMGVWIKVLQNKNDLLVAVIVEKELEQVQIKLDTKIETRDAVIDSMLKVATAAGVKADETFGRMPKKRVVPNVEFSEKVEFLKNLKR